MPTYEYECSKCRYKFEEFQKITDRPLTQCPKCEGQVRRLISGGAGIIFKGSGFYVTDYKRSSLPELKEKKSTDLKKPNGKPGLPSTVSDEKKK